MAKRRVDLLAVINQFYAQPVARVSFELIITVVVILFFALFAIRPTLLTMSDLIKEIDDKKTLDTALDQKIVALSTGQGQYLSLQGRLVALDNALPNNPELVRDLKVIEKIASDRHVAITAIGIPQLPDLAADSEASASAAVQNPTQPQDLNFSVSITGDYVTVRQFVADLQQSRRSIEVNHVSFSQSKNAGSGLEAGISLNMPFFGN